MNSLFRCPLCAQALRQGERSYTCASGHSFDIAAAGYTHLLPANKKHSKNPGDDKAMVAARSAFLDKGYYAPLRDVLADLTLRLTEALPSPALLDSGCGEGYYTAAIFHALQSAGRTPAIAGVDISKFALRKAAKRLPEGEFAVASVYHLPLGDGCADLLVNVFSPLATEEFGRVLHPGGWFLYVVPSALHLWEMKEILYEKPYENPTKLEEYQGFQHRESLPLRYTAELDCGADIMALFGMTPYAWKTPKAGVARLAALDRLTTRIGFDIHVYQRT
ncbi:MAG: methyltransferase domain-containing protein [Clostridium sp.]|nr:methyltransferase domain-containing protein [Clostridium sp.]